MSAGLGEGFAAPRAQVSDADFKAARELGERGDIALAEQAYQSILQRAREARDDYQQARALAGLGSCQLRRFAYRKSLTTLLEAKLLAQQAHNARLSGSISGNLASIYAQLNSFPEAIEEADHAIGEFQVAGEPAYLIRALAVKGDLLSDQHDLESARLAYQEAIAIAQKSKDVGNEAFAWNRLGDALSEAGEYASAEKALNRALQLRESANDSAAAITRLDLALLKLHEGNAPLALQMLDGVLANPGPAVARLPSYQVLHRRGQMLVALGRDDEALRTLYQATLKADNGDPRPSRGMFRAPPRWPICMRSMPITQTSPLALRFKGEIPHCKGRHWKFCLPAAPRICAKNTRWYWRRRSVCQTSISCC